VGVDHRRVHALVPQQLRHRPDVVPRSTPCNHRPLRPARRGPCVAAGTTGVPSEQPRPNTPGDPSRYLPPGETVPSRPTGHQIRRPDLQPDPLPLTSADNRPPGRSAQRASGAPGTGLRRAVRLAEVSVDGRAGWGHLSRPPGRIRNPRRRADPGGAQVGLAEVTPRAALHMGQRRQGAEPQTWVRFT
jgi:hypothetical protein